MKKIYTLIFCIVSVFIFAQVPAAGLIGAWPFSGNANDISGTGNNGVVNGATLTFDRCGNPNSAYTFNGTTNYILMPMAGPTGASARSLSFWAKTTNNTAGSPRATFAYGSAGAGATFQIMWNNCSLGVGFDSGTQSLIRGNNCLLNNVWHHFVVIFNPLVSTVYSNISFYIDGVLQPVITCNTGGITSIINTGGGSPITIGRSSTSATRFWSGELDDYYLYNRALTPAEVLQLYMACPPPVFGNTVVCSGSTNTYSILSISNASYTWTLPGGWTGVSTTNTISAIVNASGTVSVTASSACGAFGVSSKSVTALALPTVVVNTTNTLLCAGSAATLTGTGANNYTWSPTGATNPSIAINPTITTNYTLTGKSIVSGCSSTTVFIQNVVTSTIGAVSTGSLPCVGSNATLTASGASNYTWQPGSLTGSAVVVSPVTTKIYTLTGLAPTGCNASTTITVPVPPALTLNVSASTPSACPGTSITLTANSSGGTPPYTYSWTAGPPTATNAVTQIVGGNYTYSANSTDANSCLTTTTAAVYFFNAINFNAPAVSVCPGSQATLTVSGAASYTWAPVGFVGSSYTLFPSGTAVFTITGTSVNSCTASTTTTVLLKQVPLLPITTQSITCVNLGSATVQASGGIGPYTYSWSPSAQTNSVAANLNPGTYTLSVLDNGTGCVSIATTSFAPLIPLTGTISATTSLTCNGVNTATAGINLSGASGLESFLWTDPAGTQTLPLATNLSAAVHTITVSNPVSLCVFTNTFLVTQPFPIILNIFPSATMACVSSSIILSAINSGGTGPHTYTWNGGPTTSFYSTTQAIGGPYTYSVNSADVNGCPGSSSISLVFTSYPILSVSNIVLCRGKTGTLTASGALGYLWYPGAFPGSTLNVTPQGTSSYTVVGSTFGCTTSIVASVSVNALPNPGIISSNNVCENHLISFAAVGAGSYFWSGPNSFTSSAQNPLISFASLGDAGIYSLTLTDANGCSATTSTLINILTNPIPSAVGASVCLGEAATTMSVSGGVSYQWIGPNGYSSNSAFPSIPIVDNNTAGIYTVFVTGANLCVVSVTVPVVGYPYPLPTPTIIATPKVCLNSTVSLQGLGGISYLWAGPGNLASTNQTLTFSPDNLGMSGIYTLTVKNTSNCAASTTVNITVYNLPDATIKSSKNKTCVPFCSDFRLKSSLINSAPIKGLYFVNVPGLFSDSVITTCFQTGGNEVVKISYVDTNNCTNTSTISINAYPKPVADFEFFPPTPVANVDQVVFTNLSLTTPQSDWTWYFQNDSVYSKAQEPVFVFDFPNYFPVVLVVKNTWGCLDTVIKVVPVDDEISLYVPNVFTPNGDGKNEVFQPMGTGIITYTLDIFDKWGRKLFTTNDFYKAWDGTYRGEICQMETFVWKIQVTGSSGIEKKYQGIVTMLR